VVLNASEFAVWFAPCVTVPAVPSKMVSSPVAAVVRAVPAAVVLKVVPQVAEPPTPAEAAASHHLSAAFAPVLVIAMNSSIVCFNFM